MSQLLSMKIRSPRGFTAIELIVVVAIIGVLAALAVPPYLQWRRSLEVRETARDFVNILRQAKTDAIRTNLEQEVQFDTVLRRYGKRQGNQANNTNWALVPAVATWTNIKTEVTFTPSINIQFYPNGTSTNSLLATSVTTTIQDNAGTRIFAITVPNTGLISMMRK